MAKLIYNKSDINRLLNRMKPRRRSMNAIAFYMYQLVEDRFRTQGSSGGRAWASKGMKQLGYDDGRSILTGPSALLRKSFGYHSDDREAVLGSWAPYAKLHQLGTIGKGGKLPAIVPKRAKALFIPITDKAINSNRLVGTEAGAMRLQHGKIERITPYRVGVKSNRQGLITFSPLIRGRIKNGKLQKYDERSKTWKDGVPDFIFLRRVNIVARPMLPTSRTEVDKIVRFYSDTQLAK